MQHTFEVASCPVLFAVGYAKGPGSYVFWDCGVGDTTWAVQAVQCSLREVHKGEGSIILGLLG